MDKLIGGHIVVTEGVISNCSRTGTSGCTIILLIIIIILVFTRMTMDTNVLIQVIRTRESF